LRSECSPRDFWRSGGPRSVTARSCWTRQVGFVTNFLDTLGIGSFATTTAIFKLLHLVRDEHIPGTLNVGHTLPTVVQAYIYIQVVEVDSLR
jgi:hypothetical protein